MIVTFGNVVLEVQCTDLIHALFRLWCLRGLLFRFQFLGNIKEHIIEHNVMVSRI